MRAYLTDSEVFTLRLRASEGEDTHLLAEEFGVSYKHARKLIRGSERVIAGGPVERPRELSPCEAAFVKHFKGVCRESLNTPNEVVLDLWRECWDDWMAACLWAWRHPQEVEDAQDGDAEEAVSGGVGCPANP